MDVKAAAAALYQNAAVPVLLCDAQWMLQYRNMAAEQQFPFLQEGLPLHLQLPALDWKKIIGENRPGQVIRTQFGSVQNLQYTVAGWQTDGGYLLQMLPVDTLPALRRDHIDTAGLIEGQYRRALQVIFSNSNLLRTEMEDNDWYEALSYLDGIDKNAYRVLRITLALGEYARLSTPDMRLPEQPVEIVSYLRDFCHTVEQLLRSCEGIRFSYDLPEGAVITKMDGERFSMMLLELIDNACRCRMDETEIKLSLLLQENSYTVTLSDTGRGMEQSEIPAALLPFVSQEEYSDRTGLGLFLVNRIAALHGGKLMISSAPCQGLRASIQLPIRRPEDSGLTLSASAAEYVTDRFSLPYLYLTAYRL